MNTSLLILAAVFFVLILPIALPDRDERSTSGIFRRNVEAEPETLPCAESVSLKRRIPVHVCGRKAGNAA